MRLVRASLVVIVACSIAVVRLDAQRAEPAAASRPARWAFDLYGTFLAEAWDYNLSKENLAGGSMTVRWRVSDRWSFGVEGCGFAAKQRGHNRDAVVIGGGPFVRGEFVTRSRAAIVGDVMLGVSRADRRVPPRGTRFNYLVRTSGGVSYPLTPSITGLLLVTYVHMSNASLEGRDKNPDIQALGAMLGISVPF